MRRTILMSLAGGLLGTVLGLGAVFALEPDFDFASSRVWALPGVGGVAGLLAVALLGRVPASLSPELTSSEQLLQSLDDDTESSVSSPIQPANFHDLAAQLDRRTERLRLVKSKLAVTSSDLTRLKRSYHDLYHNAPVMYFSLEPDGRLVTFNDTLLNTLGYQREDLHGKRYIDIIPASPGDPNQPPFPRDDDHVHGHTMQWRHKNGSLADVWIRSNAVMDDDGVFVRWRCSALDLTERNRLADELRTRGDELEKMNARLRQINSELEDFTHVVSHDLKEPLRTLQAFSHILAEEYAGQLGPDGFQYINHLLQASSRLGRLVEDLLTLSQAGRITRGAQVFNMNEVIATVRRDLSDLIQRRQALVLSEGSLPDVTGDPQRVTQLVANLVANGLKYNQSNEPRVVLGLAEKQSDDDWTFYLRDNGIGIDPKYHQQVFGIFRRLHLPEEYEGTGAGLAICKKIVQAHGGRIWVESTPGEGATFFFTLPRPTANGEDGSHSYRLPDANGTPRTGGSIRGMRILLVEDMYEIGTLIKKLGQRSGLHFTWFTTAEEAWKHLQGEMPDFLLLDKNLPGMDGLELCRRVRQELHYKMPIAIFSQDQRLEDLKILRKAGANFFVSKELLSKPSLWQEKLRDLLIKSRAKTANGKSPIEPVIGEPA